MTLAPGVGQGLRDALTGLVAASGATVERGGEYHVTGRTFAVLDDEALEIRLGPVVARAAAGTPDAAASARGAEWVRFAPAVLDRFALDRATSWFEHAARLASSEARSS